MKEEMFDELLDSVRQGGAILRGDAQPSRAFEFPEKDGIPDVAAIRERFGVSQARFAEMMGISLGTLRNWEQGRRVPEGPANVLLEVAYKAPDVVRRVVRERRARFGQPLDPAEAADTGGDPEE
ncbi:MAG TPA: helix-turn-helix domain-containing protein [Longimicrobium sp.]|nr:helix-turn-helix domain-containing protein [Longimicrobium sp.]